MTEWDEWLRQLAADGRGGLGLTGRAQMKSIDRGLRYECIIAIPADVSADTFTASLRASPDAPDPTIEDFAVTVGSYADGYTNVTLTLTPVETAALPSDSNADGVEYLVFDILHTPSGGSSYRFLGGLIQIVGKVTNA